MKRPNNKTKAQEDFDQLVAACFEQQYSIIRKQRKVILNNTDPEGVHQMRVALRRILCVLQTCHQQDTRLAACAKPLAKLLGRARDVDVLLQDLKAAKTNAPALKRYKKYLKSQRLVRQKILVGALTGQPYADLRNALTHHAKYSAGMNLTTQDALEKYLHQELHKTKQLGRKAASSKSPERRHQLRLQCKQLRYFMDLFAGTTPNVARKFAKHIQSLQSLLGDLQDEQVAIEWLNAYAHQLPLQPENRSDFLAIGMHMCKHQQHAQHLLDALPQTWHQFDHKCTFKVLQRAAG